MLGPDKTNITRTDPAAMYRVDIIQRWEPTEDDDGTVGKLEYVGTSDHSIREWVTDSNDHANSDDQTELPRARTWLNAYLLENAPKILSDEVKIDAETEKIKPITLRRARRRLRVVVEPVKGSIPFTTYWRLP